MNAKSLIRMSLVGACLLSVTSHASAQSINGLWDATIVANNVDVPFHFEIVTSGSQTEGFFFEGDRKIGSTSGSFDGATLKLDYEFLNTTLEATLGGDELRGTYRNKRPNARPQEFRAKRFVARAEEPTNAPSLAGSWVMYRTSQDRFKLDVSWRLYLRQAGADFSGAILRTSGDTGTLTGRWKDGRLTMSHFAGDRPLFFEAQPNADGTLKVTLDKNATYVAARTNEAVAHGIPEPPDLSRFTSVKDPSEPFRFSGVGLDGRTITDDDMRGKVVILTLGGTWCPNCHDEAPTLVELYKEFHAQGLEVVGLFFETDPAIDAARPRILSFKRRHGVEFPLLVAGGRDEGPKKLPQLVNFSVYPTAVILGRDGRVRNVHAGFASAATGEEHDRLTRDRRDIVRRLLQERAPSSGVSTARLSSIDARPANVR
jgi:thiol-disulfide isomerase/thioredoxin